MQILRLDDLSLPGIRVGEAFTPPADLGNREIHMEGEASYPKAGLKILHDIQRRSIAYVHIFLQEGTKDWLVRLNGQDKYGATFSAWPGAIHSQGLDCTSEFRHDTKSVLARCPQLEFLRESKSELSYFLLQDPLERRIHVEFSAEKIIKRVILG